jgi:hypothetical protein
LGVLPRPRGSSCWATSTTSRRRRGPGSCTGRRGSEIGTDGYDRADKGDGLWNLAARIPAEQRFSRAYHGRGELIDHILVSHALVTHVADGDVTTGAASAIPSVADDPRASRDDAGFDHRPVLAVIDL